MNFTPLLAQIRANQQASKSLLRQARVLLCMGDRALLCLFAMQAMESATVLGAVTCAQEAMVVVVQQRPSLVLLSDQLEQGDGIALVEWLKTHHPETRVLLLVAQVQRQHAIQRAMDACCDGIVLQSRFGSGAMLAALHAVSGGGIYIDKTLRDGFRQGNGHAGPLEPLTERERQVLQEVAYGDSNQEIGQTLYLSSDTVKTHLGHVLRKLPARDRTQAALRGVRWGLIEWPDELAPG